MYSSHTADVRSQHVHEIITQMMERRFCDEVPLQLSSSKGAEYRKGSFAIVSFRFASWRLSTSEYLSLSKLELIYRSSLHAAHEWRNVVLQLEAVKLRMAWWVWRILQSDWEAIRLDIWNSYSKGSKTR